MNKYTIFIQNTFNNCSFFIQETLWVLIGKSRERSYIRTYEYNMTRANHSHDFKKTAILPVSSRKSKILNKNLPCRSEATRLTRYACLQKPKNICPYQYKKNKFKQKSKYAEWESHFSFFRKREKCDSHAKKRGLMLPFQKSTERPDRSFRFSSECECEKLKKFVNHGLPPIAPHRCARVLHDHPKTNLPLYQQSEGFFVVCFWIVQKISREFLSRLCVVIFTSFYDLMRSIDLLEEYKEGK